MTKAWLVLGLACGVAGCADRIGPGHVGLVINNAGSQRGVSDIPISTGWVFYLPGKTSVFEYPTFVQSYVWTKDEKEGNRANEEITFTTRDAMLVAVDVNVSYSLQPDKIPAFYVKFRSDDISHFTHGYLRSVARDCFNEVGGQYAVERIMGDNAQFLRDARACTQGHVAAFGVNIEQFGIIGAPRPPAQVVAAINAKVQAQQIALQKQNEVMQATADAQKAVAQATGEAQAILTRAKSQAEANRTLSQSLTPEFLEYTKMQKWNGALPQVTSGGNAWITLPAGGK